MTMTGERVSRANRRNERVVENKEHTFVAQSEQSSFVLTDQRDVDSDVELGIRSDSDSFSLDFLLSAKSNKTSAPAFRRSGERSETYNLVRKGAIELSGRAVCTRTRNGFSDDGGRGINRAARPVRSRSKRVGTPGRMWTFPATRTTGTHLRIGMKLCQLSSRRRVRRSDTQGDDETYSSSCTKRTSASLGKSAILSRAVFCSSVCSPRARVFIAIIRLCRTFEIRSVQHEDKLIRRTIVSSW